MAAEGGNKPEVGFNQVPLKKPNGWVVPLLRLVAFSSTVAATIVMALNKQTKAIVVATVGSTPIEVTLTAKFQHTPAFVFFVIANSMASFHTLLMLGVEIFGNKFDFKGLRLAIIPILDMMTVAQLAVAAGGATFMGELGRNGNSHARWNKICDKFDTFCDHGGGAIIASFLGLLLLMAVTALSILKLRTVNYSVVDPAA